MSSVLQDKCWNLGKFCLAIFLLSGLSCSSRSPKPKLTQYQTTTEVPPEVKLNEDREFLEKERAKVPEQRREQNDELAFVLQLMNSDYTLAPWEVRQRFDKVVRDKQSKFTKILQSDREAYSKDENKKNSEFLATQKKRRERFQKKRNHTSEDTREFYNEMDQDRRDFFAAQNEKRREFESSIQEKRYNFDNYVKDKRSQFDLAYKEYSKGYYDYQMIKRAKEQSNTPAPSNEQQGTDVPLKPMAEPEEQ